jgi:hypothetical protein
MLRKVAIRVYELVSSFEVGQPKLLPLVSQQVYLTASKRGGSTPNASLPAIANATVAD